MTTQTSATAEMAKWLRFRVRFFTNFWLRVRKKNAESFRSRLRHSGSGPTPGCIPRLQSLYWKFAPILIITKAKMLTYFCANKVGLSIRDSELL